MRRSFNLCLAALLCLVSVCRGQIVSGTTTPGIRSKVIYVNAGGNLYAASRAATNGTTIVVGPGTYYDCTNLLKNGVNWFFYPGAWLTLTNNTNFGRGEGIFDDRWSGAVTSIIGGEVSIRWCSGLPGTNSDGTVCLNCYPTNTLGAVTITNHASAVRMDYDRVEFIALSTTRSPFWIVNTLESHFNGREIEDLFYHTNYYVGLDEFDADIYAGSQGVGFYWESGECHLTVDRVRAKQYSIWPQARTDAHSNLWVTCDLAVGSVYVDGTGAPADWRTWFTPLKQLETDTNSGGTATFKILGGGRHYLDTLKIQSGQSYPAVAIAAGELWLAAQKISSRTKWLEVSGTATVDMEVQQYEDLGGMTSGFEILGGSTFVHGGRAEASNATVVAYYGTAGQPAPTAVFNGVRLGKASITNSPVMVRTNGLTLANCTVISTNTFFSISSDVNATNAVRLMNVFATSGMTNKATNAVVIGSYGPFNSDDMVR